MKRYSLILCYSCDSGKKNHISYFLCSTLLIATPRPSIIYNASDCLLAEITEKARTKHDNRFDA